MDKNEKILNYLYPTKNIKEQIDLYNQKSFRKNIALVIIFGILGAFVVVLSFSIEGKLVFILTTLINYFLLTVLTVFLYIGNKTRVKLDKMQLEIIIKEKKNYHLRIIKNRNKYKRRATIVIIVMLLISLYFSFYNFIEGLVKDDYNSNPVLVFYLVFFVLLIPVIILFVFGVKAFQKAQIKIIEESEKQNQNNNTN